MSIAGNVGLRDLPRICPLISRRVQSSTGAGETRVVFMGDSITDAWRLNALFMTGQPCTT